MQSPREMIGAVALFGSTKLIFQHPADHKCGKATGTGPSWSTRVMMFTAVATRHGPLL
jgi:hypothetical protein